MGKKDGKPRGKMSAYAYFVQTCREELKKKNPNETVVFAEFSKKCGEKWKAMTGKDKKRFDEMAAKDKVRYDKEMVNFTPAAGSGKRKKDPNAPKRALSAFFCFCNDERPKVRALYPSYSVGDVAKELGKRWEACKSRTKYEQLAAKDRQRYERDMAVYRAGGGAKKAAAKPAAKKPAKKVVEEEVDDEDDEEEEEEDEESD